VTLAGITRDLSAGMTVNMVLGCNRSLILAEGGIGLDPDTDCHTIHNNMNNFGGCAFIPNKNPIGRLNQFY